LKEKKLNKKKQKGGIFETIKTLIYAIIIAMLIRTVGYEPFNIPSGSMKPSLLVGDYLFVSKFSYGYSRYSIPLGLPIFNGRIFSKYPERGDVAVFKLPSDNSTDYIKRVIGLPGDEIQIRDGVLFINNKKVIREKVKDFYEKDRYGNTVRVEQYKEILPNGVEYLTLDTNEDSVADNTRVYKIKPGHVFMMGDNRDDSADSRFSQVGQVPVINFVGKAEILFFSLYDWKIRFNRILMMIR
tara:strand:- start:782 stop:1504 length:723 start_codon:yes stop_codon:yes gene_type:complete